MMTGAQFALMASAALTDKAALTALMALGLGTGFMARLARKELHKIGIQIEATNDSSSAAAVVR